MTCDYECLEDKCIQEVTYSIKDGPPKSVLCPVCKKEMNRVWQASIIIPEWFGDDSYDTLKDKMAHAPRPTGRERTLF